MKTKEMWLQWFFEFINVDLSVLPKTDLYKLLFDMIELMHPYAVTEIPNSPGDLRRGTSEDVVQTIASNMLSNMSDIVEAQRQLQEFMKAIVDKKNNYEEIEGSWRPLRAIGNRDPYSGMPFFKSFNFTVNVSVGLSCQREERRGESGFLYQYPTGSIRDGVISMEYGATQIKDILFFHFCRLIDGLELKVFRVCRECQRYFIHFSERSRDFCSNKCASRYGIRERRRAGKESDAERVRDASKKKVSQTRPRAKVKR